jgi:hypothetical protein
MLTAGNFKKYYSCVGVDGARLKVAQYAHVQGMQA